MEIRRHYSLRKNGGIFIRLINFLKSKIYYNYFKIHLYKGNPQGCGTEKKLYWMCFPNEQDYSYFSRDNYSIKFVVKEKYTEQIDLLRNFKRNIEIEPTVDSSMLKGTTEID